MTKFLLVISLMAVMSTAYRADAFLRVARQVQQEMIEQENITNGLTLNEVTNTLVEETRGLGKLILDFISNLGSSMRSFYSTRQTRSNHEDPVEVVLTQVHHVAKNVSQMSPDELHQRVKRATNDIFNLFNWGGSDDELNAEFSRLAEENGNGTETDGSDESTDEVTESSSSLFKLFKRSAQDEVPSYESSTEDTVPTYDPTTTKTTKAMKSTTHKATTTPKTSSGFGDILPAPLNGLLMQTSLGSLFGGAFDSTSAIKDEKKGNHHDNDDNKHEHDNGDNKHEGNGNQSQLTASNSNKHDKHEGNGNQSLTASNSSSPVVIAAGSPSEVLTAAGLPPIVSSLISNLKFPASLVGPQGLPGLPGRPGKPGLPGAVIGLNALRSLIVVKVGTILALLKAVFILSCLKSAALLALLLGLVIPIYGKWKKAGVVLPVAADAPYPSRTGYADAVPASAQYVMNHIDNGYKKYQ